MRLIRLFERLFPDPCAGSAEIQRQLTSISDEDEDENGVR